jgi:hypothetical protein
MSLSIIARTSPRMTPSARIKVSVVGSESKSAIDGSPSACAQGRFAFTEVAGARVSPTHRTNSVAEFPYPAPFTAAKNFRGGTFLRLFGGGVGSTGSVDMAFPPNATEQRALPARCSNKVLIRRLRHCRPRPIAQIQKLCVVIARPSCRPSHHYSPERDGSHRRGDLSRSCALAPAVPLDGAAS